MIHEPSDGEACESPAHEPLVCECRYPRPDAVGECTRCRRLVITIDAVTAHARAFATNTRVASSTVVWR